MEFSFSDLSTGSSSTEEIPVKVLIVGSGPAGLSAALYAARADLAPVVLTGMELGGQVSLTHIVENYPGFPEGVGGPELVELFQKQAERFGAKLEYDTVTEVDLSERPFRVKTYNTTYLAETLIITTGATPRHLDIPGESELTGRGVSYCGTCDGWFFKEKDVVVVGGGDSALEEGLFLTRYATKERIGQILNSAYYRKEIVTVGVADGYYSRLVIGQQAQALLAMTRDMHKNAIAFPLEDIAFPTLILWGEQDTWVKRADIDRWRDHIPSAEFHVIPETGHLPMEEDPELVNDMVLAFLESH